MLKAAQRNTKPPVSNMEKGQTCREESIGLLKTIDKSLDDIRAVITCRVCVRPLYEPFTIECGHTFCYSCLISWFEKSTTHKSCPDCRAKITRKPAPAYLVRDMTQLFSNRAELLPPGETTQEHQGQQQEEAGILEKDKNGGGLFRGWFSHGEQYAGGHGNRIIIDDEDGVSRCPRCTWEMEDDMCAGCGWPTESDYWDTESGSGEQDEDAFLREAMGIAEGDFGYEDGIPSLDDEDDEEDDSAGSLDGFVVNDEQVQELRHTTSGSEQPLHWRHPALAPNDIPRGQYSPIASSNEAPTSEYESESQAFDHSSDGDTDGASPGGDRSSRSMSADSMSNDDSSIAIENLAPNVRSVRNRVLLDSDDENTIPLPTGARNIGRHRPDRVSRLRNQEARSSSRNLTQILNHSAQANSHSRAPASRGVSDAALHSDQNPARAVIYLTSDDEDPPRTVHQRAMRNNASPMQAMRRRAARQMITDEDDEDDEDEEYDDNDIDRNHLNALMQTSSSRLPQQQGRSLWGLNGSTSDPNQIIDSPNRRLDPATSIPVRGNNVNMPGAFPPSFVSEQGQLQSTPPMNVEAFISPNLRDQTSLSRPERAPEESEQGFHSRRRHEESTTQATHTQQTRRRDRSATKAARRQERRRLKAEQDARGRRDTEPSAPPLMTL